MLTRRQVMPRLAAAGAFLALGASASAGPNAGEAADALVIGGGPLSDEAASGVAMGIEEAQRTAALLGKQIKWQATPAGAGAIVTTGSIATHGCAFSLMPSEATMASRLDAWRRQNAGAAAIDGAHVEAWHASLVKFGASELNTRFARFAHRPMTSDAWLGWCAVKAVTEGWLRDGTSLCRALADLEFDGHKGEPLSFDPATATLRHPLYIVAGGAVIGTLP